MAVASLLLTISVYILLPVMPRWLMEEENFTPVEVGRGVFGLGLYLFGSCCSWLVQRYRRNVVCMWAIVAVIVNLVLLLYIDTLRTTFVDFTIIMVHRFMLGATFGLAQMVLTSTLVIDTCESFQRTEANHSASWFSRFALSLGPLAGLIVSALYGFEGVVWSAVGCAVGALLSLPYTGRGREGRVAGPFLPDAWLYPLRQSVAGDYCHRSVVVDAF